MILTGQSAEDLREFQNLGGLTFDSPVGNYLVAHSGEFILRRG
ncbi:Uncharacterized protein dnm_069820 [Desulfonema magnum]|uniref:Uncharacterized protein n=1 Tax=Desulfonema magnum TaxID=45655 RepID=A0A975BSQ8_9BACT|nr:Uncharacterized protein dnm_069820 [Desulfonema magnum]